jgi:hypothetical protein
MEGAADTVAVVIPQLGIVWKIPEYALRSHMSLDGFSNEALQSKGTVYISYYV